MGPYVELPMVPRSAVMGVADACGHPHWGPGEAPYGATKRCTGCGGRKWPSPLGPWVGFPLWGHEAL
eukprot:9483936-Pyramimonas_sp.AAC.1